MCGKTRPISEKHQKSVPAPMPEIGALREFALSGEIFVT
jgi:hypothetical protein